MLFYVKLYSKEFMIIEREIIEFGDEITITTVDNGISEE